MESLTVSCMTVPDSQAANGQPVGTEAAAAAAEAAAASAEASRQAAYEAAMTDNLTRKAASPIQARLAKELYDKGFSDFR